MESAFHVNFCVVWLIGHEVVLLLDASLVFRAEIEIKGQFKRIIQREVVALKKVVASALWPA
jgi:hypothetical protein